MAGQDNISDVDFDEDGNPDPSAYRRMTRKDGGRDSAEAGSVADTDRRLGQRDSGPPADAPNPAALARPGGPVGSLLQPKKDAQPGTPLAIVTSHFDFPEQISVGIHKIREVIANDCWDFEWNPTSYYRVLEMCNSLFSLIAGQIDKLPELTTAMPTFHQDYLNLADLTDGWGEEINAKLELMSRAIKLAGMGVRDAPKPSPVVLPEAMHLRIRSELEPWQERPDEAGVVQVSELVAQSIVKRRLMLLIVDVDPFAGIAFGGGKSQLLWQVGYWAFVALGQVFDGRKDIVYRADRARMTRLMGESENVPILVDEINQFFDMWNWNDPRNKYLVHQVEMYRKVGRPILGACSQIWILNKRFREVIVTHRLSVTRWDDDAYTGEATLFEKWGPPASQDEKENKWGREIRRIKFAGLTPKQFRFYSACADKTRDVEEKQSLDDYMAEYPLFLADLADQDPKGAITLRVDPPKDSGRKS